MQKTKLQQRLSDVASPNLLARYVDQGQDHTRTRWLSGNFSSRYARIFCSFSRFSFVLLTNTIRCSISRRAVQLLSGFSGPKGERDGAGVAFYIQCGREYKEGLLPPGTSYALYAPPVANQTEPGFQFHPIKPISAITQHSGRHCVCVGGGGNIWGCQIGQYAEGGNCLQMTTQPRSRPNQ